MNKKNIAIAALVCAFSAVSNATAQVELIAGWNFGQFVGPGVPSTDPVNYDQVTSVTSNFSGTTRPSPEDGGAYRAGNAGTGFFTSGTGVLDFAAWTGHDGTSTTLGGVTAFEVGSIEAANGSNVNGVTIFNGDDNNAQLRFTAGAGITDFTVSLNTSAYGDYAPADYTQTNDSNLTIAAYKASGASASIEWFFNGSSLGSVTTSSANPAAFSIDLPASFYGLNSAVLTGRVTGDITIDHLQINGVSAIPEPSSFAMIAAFAGLATAGLRRRRA
jgi:hypothetical protein